MNSLVWFKKDLRTKDHRPLYEALEMGPTVALFVIEDEWVKGFEYSDIHAQFLTQSLTELKSQLDVLNVPFFVLTGHAEQAISHVKKTFNFDQIISHQETGLYWTYQRDLRVKSWCKENAVEWKEYQQFAVIRRLKDRDQWNKLRAKVVNTQLCPHPKPQRPLNISARQEGLNYNTVKQLQPGGRTAALDLLTSFLSHRGENYSKQMSSPVTAFDSCSRLSPHITWGTVSLSEITYELKKQKAKQLSKNWYRSLKSFESRLWWHCHFIQKLESEPEIEFNNINPGFDGMRESEFNDEYFEAWKKGETGYPIIDACMRALKQHGWINFRMRAMLVSFASYHLWLHWQKPAQFLSKYFVDFEPGIHFSQFQMQSGVTGINSIRIYSPKKQSLDQDPEGQFIKSYCPELEGLDSKYIHEVEETPPMLLTLSGVKLGENYPYPIVDHKLSYNLAKKRVFEWRSKPEVKSIARGVYQKHGSRKNSHFPTQPRKAFGNLKHGS